MPECFLLLMNYIRAGCRYSSYEVALAISPNGYDVQSPLNPLSSGVIYTFNSIL